MSNVICECCDLMIIKKTQNQINIPTDYYHIHKLMKSMCKYYVILTDKHNFDIFLSQICIVFFNLYIFHFMYLSVRQKSPAFSQCLVMGPCGLKGD